jgi:branched-chain amino acid transport system substrate-binding protein
MCVRHVHILVRTKGDTKMEEPSTISREKALLERRNKMGKTGFNRLGWVFVVLLSFLFLMEGYLSPSPAWAQDTIRFGAALPYTGRESREGRLSRDGMELWRDVVNKKGGIKVGNKSYKVDILFYDDESDPRTTAKLVEKLVTEDNIKFVLGPYGSTPSFAASAITEKYKALIVVGMGSAEAIFERGFKYLFGPLTTASYYLVDSLKLCAAQKPKPETVAIIYKNELFSTQSAEGGKKVAEDLGFKVVYFEKYPPDAKDLSSVISIIRAKNPDIYIVSGHFEDSFLAVKQAKELKLNPKVIIGNVGVATPDFITSLREDAEYVLGPTQWVPNQKTRDHVFGSAEDYTKLYEKTYGYTPDYHSAGQTSAALIFQLAIEKAQSLDVDKVRDAMSALDTDSFFGHIKFNEKGINVAKGMAVLQIQKGKHVPIYPPAVTLGKFIYPKPPWK